MPLACCSLVPVVLAIFGLAYASFTLSIVFSWLLGGTHAMFQFILMNVFWWSMTYNYLMAVIRSPGNVPKDWTPENHEELRQILDLDASSGEEFISEKQRENYRNSNGLSDVLDPTSTQQNRNADEQDSSSAVSLSTDESTVIDISDNAGSNTKKSQIEALRDQYYSLSKHAQVKYCKKCNAYKPPRAHHCSECKKCVLRMDHHCPWINNCVGYNNHKHFLLFLLYLTLAGIHMLIMFVWRLIDLFVQMDTENDKFEFSPLEGILIGVTIIIIIPSVLGVSCLLVFQLQMVMDNTTVIEGFDTDFERRKAHRKGKSYHFIYDRGTCENLRDILGSHPALWCIPTPPEGDGLNYQMSKSTV